MKVNEPILAESVRSYLDDVPMDTAEIVDARLRLRAALARHEAGGVTVEQLAEAILVDLEIVYRAKSASTDEGKLILMLLAQQAAATAMRVLGHATEPATPRACPTCGLDYTVGNTCHDPSHNAPCEERDERGEFEEWARTKRFHLSRRDDDQELYTNSPVNIAWLAWQARSRRQEG